MWGDISQFWFAFPQWLVMLTISSCTCWAFEYQLWKNVYLGPLSVFLFGLFRFFYYWVVGVPYVFWILEPYQICGLQILSSISCCLFILLMVSFVVQKLFSLILLLLPLLFVSNQKRLVSKSLPPMVSSRSFMVSENFFSCLIKMEHLELF